MAAPAPTAKSTALGFLGDVADKATSFGFGQFAASRQNKFQKEILNNRYQWQVADMKAAGINPILAVTSPPPAPTVPIGGFAPHSGGGTVETAKKISKLSPEMALLRQQLELMKIETEKTQHAANTQFFTAQKERLAVERERLGIGLDAQSLRFGQTRMPAALATEKLDRSATGTWMRYLNRTIRSLTGRESTDLGR